MPRTTALPPTDRYTEDTAAGPVRNHGAHPKIGPRLDPTRSARKRGLSVSEQDTVVAASIVSGCGSDSIP
jgi:hypothetical protein